MCNMVNFALASPPGDITSEHIYPGDLNAQSASGEATFRVRGVVVDQHIEGRIARGHLPHVLAMRLSPPVTIPALLATLKQST